MGDPRKASGVVILIDENQIIAAMRDVGKFDPCAIVEKVRQRIDGKIERAYFYISEATEKHNRSLVQSLIWLDHPLIRVVKTGSQPGVVDRRIREDVTLWSRMDFVSAIVLGTADGGSDFLEAIEQIKKSGKKFVLLKLGKQYNFALCQLADDLVDAAGLGRARRPFEQIVKEIRAGNIHPDELNTRFLLAITAGVLELFENNGNKAVGFGEIIEHSRDTIRSRREFDSFTDQDMREGLTAVTRLGRLLSSQKDETGKCLLYRLSSANIASEMLDNPVRSAESSRRADSAAEPYRPLKRG